MGILTVLLSAMGGLFIASLPYVFRKSWESREIRSLFSLRLTMLTLFFSGFILGIFTGLATSSPVVGLSAAITGSLIALTILTDLGSMRIPKEPCWIAIGIGLCVTLIYPMSATTRIVIVAASLITWALLAIVVFVSGGLGMGDVRFVLAVSLLTTWWAGPLTGVIIVFVGSVIQLLARALFARKRPSWLKVDPDHPRMLPFGPALAIGAVFVTIAGAAGVQF